MGKYGDAAVEAVRLHQRGLSPSPRDAWESATADVFGKGTSSQQKACPRDTFLSLCQEGLVQGVERGSCTRSVKNRRYALDAVQLLKRNPALASHPDTLWATVVAGESKKHNSQMDVVTALWTAGLICP
jgi:hypothetical protein